RNYEKRADESYNYRIQFRIKYLNLEKYLSFGQWIVRSILFVIYKFIKFLINIRLRNLASL
ncbi:MAG: hypothetical protein ACTSR2_07110, partial [Candidatus Hodarchaeales archaeon]